MKLASVASADQRLIRTIVWSSGTRENVLLAVTLEYVAPEVLREEQRRSETRILRQRKITPMEDAEEVNTIIEKLWFSRLADAVQKIALPGGAPVTLRTLKSLISLSPEAVKEAGGLATVVDLDPADKTSLSEEERKQGGHGEDVKTKGEVARQNILYLIRVHTGFRGFLEQTITDVSNFQDGDWEEQVKNS